MPNTAEQAIYDRLASAPSFHPASAELLLNDWTLEPGDVVTVKSGEQNYSLPVYSLNLNWTGSNLGVAENSNTTRIAIESTGHKEREPLPELRRKQFEQGRYSYTGFKAQQQEIDEHYQHVVQVTDKGMSDAFGILGVSIGADGYPVTDGSGNYVWNDSGAGGEIWGHLNRNAWETQILNHIKDANGNIISLAEVYTDAYGQAIINAINDQRTGLAQIRADRIKIDSTSGSSFTIENDGTMTFNAENAIAAINAATAEINAGKIKLTSSQGSDVTLDSKLSLNSDGYIELNGTTAIWGNLRVLGSSNFITSPGLTIGSGGASQGEETGSFSYRGESFNIQRAFLGYPNNYITLGRIMTTSATELDFNHSHAVSMEEVTSGSNAGKVHAVIGIPVAYSSSSTANRESFFDIAASQTYIDGVAARTAHSISRIELTSSDTGSSSQSVTVYSLDDWEEDLSVIVDASSVYSVGDSAGYNRAANQRTTLTATSNGTYTPSFGYSSVTVNVPSSSIAVNDIQLYASGYQQGTQSKTGVTTSLGSNSDGSDPVQIFSNTVFQLDHWYCFKINVNGVSKGYYFKASS